MLLRPVDVLKFKKLIAIFAIVFEGEEYIHHGDKELAEILQTPGFHVFTGIYKDGIIGGATVYTIISYTSGKPSAYIYDLAVHPDFQGRGAGRLLISEIKRYFASKGYNEVYVQADADDERAIEFYRKTECFSESEVVQFSYKL